MRPAEGTHLFFLEDQGILFQESEQKLFHLNTVATFIWCLMEEDKDRQTIESELQHTFALTPSDASRYWEQTETLFKSLGVLHGFEPVQTDEPETTAPRTIEYGNDSFIADRRYRLLSSHFRIRFSHMDQLVCVDPVLHHLQEEGSTEPTVTLDIIQEEGKGLVLCRDRIAVLSCHDREQLAPLAKSLVWQTAVNSHDFFLDIHAAVIGDGAQCYLFPAAPGSGKSTLTAALVHRGFEFFSDEVALLHEHNLQVQPVPLATCVKDTGIEPLLPYYPGLAELPSHLRGDGKRVRYMAPPTDSVPAIGTRRPVGAIIFPHYSPDQPTRLDPLDTMTALQSLMQECLIVDTRLDRNKVANLLSWIDRTPCYRLAISDLDQAVALVSGIANTPKRAHRPVD